MQTPPNQGLKTKAKFVSNKDESIPLFNNPILEYFSHIHPITPVLGFVPVALYCLYQAIGLYQGFVLLGLFLAGLLFWTFTEYVLHRWVFHYQPSSRIGKHLHFLLHGIHHDYPNDSTRLVMPLLLSLPLSALFFLGFYLCLNQAAYGFFSGFILGYVAYDSLHFLTHHWNAKFAWVKFLKNYHMRHHYQDDDTAFGVSTPLWDYVFGTVPAYLKDKCKTKQFNDMAKS